MARRIDSLEAGSAVVLEFVGSMGNATYTEKSVFQGIEGTGDKRRARFVDNQTAVPFEWEAYRFNGHWAYGSSADRLRLLEVV